MKLRGELRLPGDKSIAHRALILSSLCPGVNRIQNLPSGLDVLATRQCLSQLGLEYQRLTPQITEVRVPKVLSAPQEPLDAGNSATTMRLLAGLLCSQPFKSRLQGDTSLSRRPMKRIIAPLKQMGADIDSADGNGCAPLTVHAPKRPLRGIEYSLPVASAQVKSAILIAALFAQGRTRLCQPVPTRDHTERMLGFLGAPLRHRRDCMELELPVGRTLQPSTFELPGDISSAAFFIVAALLCPDSDILVRNVCLNPYRTGFIDVLWQMGARIEVLNGKMNINEPNGDIRVQSSALKGNIRIAPEKVPSLIDELPVLAVAGVFNDGTLTVEGAAELKHKESNRLAVTVRELAKLGVAIQETPDGFSVTGNPAFTLPEQVLPMDPEGDHRMAMALSILRLAAGADPGPLREAECIKVSYPGFFKALEILQAEESAL